MTTATVVASPGRATLQPGELLDRSGHLEVQDLPDEGALDVACGQPGLQEMSEVVDLVAELEIPQLRRRPIRVENAVEIRAEVSATTT